MGEATSARTIAPATIREAFSVGSGVGESAVRQPGRAPHSRPLVRFPLNAPGVARTLTVEPGEAETELRVEIQRVCLAHRRCGNRRVTWALR